MIATDPFSIEAIRRRLRTSVVGRDLLFGEVELTNTLLSRPARSGDTEGSVVLAESQRHGRGRLGQVWFSPSGVNLYASVLFRERLTPRAAAQFSFIAGLAQADAIEELGLHVLVDTKKVKGADR